MEKTDHSLPIPYRFINGPFQAGFNGQFLSIFGSHFLEY